MSVVKRKYRKGKRFSVWLCYSGLDFNRLLGEYNSLKDAYRALRHRPTRPRESFSHIRDWQKGGSNA